MPSIGAVAENNASSLGLECFVDAKLMIMYVSDGRTNDGSVQGLVQSERVVWLCTEACIPQRKILFIQRQAQGFAAGYAIYFDRLSLSFLLPLSSFSLVFTHFCSSLSLSENSTTIEILISIRVCKQSQKYLATFRKMK